MEVMFLEITVNLKGNTDQPNKKTNDRLTYIPNSSNDLKQLIKYLTQTISER